MSANTFDRRSGNFFVGASDASAASKERADYICNGIADEVGIQAAIDGLPGGRGPILQNKFQGEQWFSTVQSYWKARFPSVEKRLLTASGYVEPSPLNRAAYGPEFASILKESGSIFGSVADALVRGAGMASGVKRKKYEFFDYARFLRTEVPDIHRRSVDLGPAHPRSIVVPLEELQVESGIPDWWHAYNAVKHRETGEFHRGNLENCVTAACAVALLGGLIGVTPGGGLFVNVNIAHKEGSMDLSDERRLFPRASIL